MNAQTFLMAKRRMATMFLATALSLCLVLTGLVGLPDPAAADEDFSAPPGFVAAAPAEYFGPDTLFEIINGDADLYLKAGFARLAYRRFTLQADPQVRLEFFAYRMQDHRRAFAVYSVRRGEAAQPSPLARFAHRYRNGLFLVHGPYYLEILSAEASPRAVAAANDLAAAFMAAHDVAADAIPELDLFPPEGLVPGSPALHPANAFGFDGFSFLFTARYRLKDQQATAFFRPCESPEAAEPLAAAFETFLADYDAVAVDASPLFPEGRLMRLLDSYTLVFVHDHTVAGVHEAGSPELAARLARALQARLAREE
jgi:hypothetical protein